MLILILNRQIKYRFNEIQEDIHDYFNDECYDDGFYEDDDIIDDSKNIQNNIYCLHDLMKADLVKKQSTMMRSKKSAKISTHLEERGTAKINQHKEQKKVIMSVCNEGNDRKEEQARDILLDLEIKSPWLHHSRLGKHLHGSTKILCSDLKVAFLMVWNVGENSFDIYIIPVINCSQLENSSIHSICKKMSKTIQMQFEKQLNAQGKSGPQNKHDVFYELSSFVVDCENVVLLQLSQELSSLSGLEQNLSAPLEKILKKSTNVNVECSLDYYDIFAQSNIDCDQIESIHECKPRDETFCTICFDSFKDNDMHLRTCGHAFCDSCWK